MMFPVAWSRLTAYWGCFSMLLHRRILAITVNTQTSLILISTEQSFSTIFIWTKSFQPKSHFRWGRYFLPNMGEIFNVSTFLWQQATKQSKHMWFIEEWNIYWKGVNLFISVLKYNIHRKKLRNLMSLNDENSKFAESVCFSKTNAFSTRNHGSVFNRFVAHEYRKRPIINTILAAWVTCCVYCVLPYLASGTNCNP